MKPPVPTEEVEQIALVTWLSLRRPRILYTATANGARTSMRQAIKLKRTGVRAGVPDVLIFTPAPKVSMRSGVAIELKRQFAAPSVVSPEQREWLLELERCGWTVFVARGAEEAIRNLERLGY